MFKYFCLNFFLIFYDSSAKKSCLHDMLAQEWRQDFMARPFISV
ncbi:hypothetical protein GCWU000341_01060 [Oribacterium sp. oral taxon 078 str. F0262]|nr:hypothetical protein GCWU000341_01060 [Oribacterium sp. oral taxon 078 str. F0262]